MASILELMKPKAAPGGESLPGAGGGALDRKAAALKSMWKNMQAGDFKSAAMDFHDAYEACAEAVADEDEPETDEFDMGGGLPSEEA